MIQHCSNSLSLSVSFSPILSPFANPQELEQRTLRLLAELHRKCLFVPVFVFTFDHILLLNYSFQEYHNVFLFLVSSSLQ